MTRKATVAVFHDVTGWAPKEDAWSAYDTETYDGALDAPKQVVGRGGSPEEALENYDEKLEEERNRLLGLRAVTELTGK